METTLVIFRKWRQSEKLWPDLGPEVFALFPLIPANGYGFSCLSYEHVGQHSGANYYHCMQDSHAASAEEYAALKAELESLGYRLRVGKRAPHNALEQRRATVEGE